ncbi:MAG: SEC-C domain-containing protein [Acidimicrobiia bacterium]|nr:SEC-C domain-containing protein [Acidimicrobiia bacterium]
MNRQTLAKIDKRILSQMDHDEGVQLVKVPVSEAVWSTWRRYCEAVGLPMGRALAVLLHQELASVVDEDLDRTGTMLGEREALVAAGEAALDVRERKLATREKALAVQEQRFAAQTKASARPPMAPVSKLGRNELCWCGSGTKFKYCHGRSP